MLASSPLCADPFGDHARDGVVVAASEVDHIKPKRNGGRDDWDNLQTLCQVCHSKKTAAEGARWG
jgi:5-methylcytosine-specific restriction protein A